MSTDTVTREFTRPAIAVVALCFALNSLARGCGEIFAVFYGPLLQEFDWSRASTSSIYAVFMIAIAVSVPAIGMLFDRYGPRTIYVGGLLVYGSGFLIAARMTSLWEGWLGLGILVGIGAAATGMTPATGIISRWFDRNMAFAISLVYVGFAFGAVLLAPLTGLMIEEIGWRATYAWLGWSLIASSLLLLVLPWHRIGAGVRSARPVSRALLPGSDVFRTSAFWGLFIVFFCTSTATYAIQVQAVVYLEEVGFERLQATFIYGLNSLASITGILGAGWLADRIGQRWVATLAYIGTIVGILSLAALSLTSHPLFVTVFLLGFGGTMGTRGPMVSSLTARLFEKNVGAVFGLVMIGLGLGGAFGAWISGWLYEQTDGYEAGFALAIVSCLIGMAQFWLIPELKRGVWRNA